MNDNVLDYIRKTCGDEPGDLTVVNGGLTLAGKYKVTFGGKKWMAKLVSGDHNRLLWYRELDRRATDRMANPTLHKLFDDGMLCLMYEWVDGVGLDSILSGATPDEALAYGKQAAEILLDLHRDSFEHPAPSKIKERILSVCETVERLGLTFPGHDECCAFLRREAENHCFKKVSFVHKDVRPENFIVSDGKLYLIDFDNGSLGDPASDFVYLTTMGAPEHRLFSRAFTERYLQSADLPSFWQDNLLYSSLQVAEYAIWKWNTKGRQVYYQAENLMQQYDDLTSYKPRWWDTL